MATDIKTYTLADVAKHASEKDLWMVIHDKVYDLTKFLDEHPGGDIMLDGAGIDATTLYEDVGHSNASHELLKDYYIGELAK